MLTRSARRCVALLAVAGIAFAQLAVAAYACPIRAPEAPAAGVHGNRHGVAAGEHCAGMGAATATPQANACEVHCIDGATLPASPDLPPVTLALLPAPALPLAALAATGVLARSPLAAQPGAPPLTLQFCRLLI